MPLIDFIYAGTPREYEAYIKHRPDCRSVPVLISVEQLRTKEAPRVLAIGEYHERSDFDAVAQIVHARKGEWVVPP